MKLHIFQAAAPRRPPDGTARRTRGDRRRRDGGHPRRPPGISPIREPGSVAALSVHELTADRRVGAMDVAVHPAVCLADLHVIHGNQEQGNAGLVA